MAIGFGSDINSSQPEREHPSFDGWSSEQVEKYFSELDDQEIAEIVQERLSGSISEVSSEELALRFGVDLGSLMPPLPPVPLVNPANRVAGFALPDSG